jgi:hypothetical protein
MDKRFGLGGYLSKFHTFLPFWCLSAIELDEDPNETNSGEAKPTCSVFRAAVDGGTNSH